MHLHLPHLLHIQTQHLAKNSQAEEASGRQEALWTKGFFAISLINLLVLSSGNMLIPTFPFYLKSLGGTEMIVGLAASLYSIASMIMRPVVGWVLDHKGRKGIFYIGVVGIILVALGYNFAATIPLLILLRVIHGFMTSAANTSCSTNACDIIPQSRFAEGIGMFGLTNSLAMAIAPAMGQSVMDNFGFGPMFYCCAGIGILSLLCLSRLKINVPKPKIRQRSGSIPLKARLSSIVHRDALPGSLVLLLAMIPGGSISSFISLYAAEEAMGVGSVYFLVQAIGTGSARLFSGRIADRNGEGPMVYLSSALYLLGLALLVFGQVPAMLYLSGLLYGWAYGLSIPALQTMAIRIVPREQRGAASSTYLCSYDVGWAMGGLLGGVMETAFGYRHMFALMSLWIFASVALYYFWARNSRSAFRNLPKTV